MVLHETPEKFKLFAVKYSLISVCHLAMLYSKAAGFLHCGLFLNLMLE